jgi:hypothetical protein
MCKIEWLEKWKPHQMIPVGMSEDEMILKVIILHQLVAEPADSGSSIDDNDIAAFCPDFKAGGIASVFKVMLA